jgi:hypothetical protein
MSLPIRRATNYTVGLQVKSADLNALQDFRIGARGHFLEDFFGDVSARWNTTNPAGTGVATWPSGATSSHKVDVATSGASNDETVLTTGARLVSMSASPAFRARVRFVTTLADREDEIGFEGTNGRLRFRRHSGTFSGNWILEAYTDGALVTQDLGLAPAAAGTWYVLTMQVIDATHVYWSVATSETAAPLGEGTITTANSLLTISSGTPNTNAIPARIRVKTLTAAVRRLEVDYVSATVERFAAV